MAKVSTSGVGFRLSDAESVDDRVVTPPAATQPLSAGDTRKVLDRLPKLAAVPGDEKDFALRAGSVPAPRTGKTVSEAFPPPPSTASQPAAASGPLRVLRHAPDGAVALASNLSVTFSKPMVAVTSHDDLAAQQLPVRVTPQPPGKWRWVGTQTLLFEPTGDAERLPMATDYEVEVPSTSDRWRFSTPAPKLVASYPDRDTPVRFDPVLFLAFDQAVDPAAVLKSLEVTGNARPVKLRLATAEEVEAARDLAPRIKDSMPGRWLAVRPEEPLAPDARLTVHVRPGTPSREGPKKTTADQSFDFATHGALRVTRHQCGWGSTCRPRMPFEIAFSNQLDVAAFDKNLVRVEPPMAEMKVVANYQSISVSGRTRGKTTYKVTIGGGLRDEFGQALGRDQTLSFTTDRSEPELFPADREMIVLDAAEGTKLPVYSVNQPTLAVALYAVTPQDWSKYAAWNTRSYRDRSPGAPPGELVSRQSVTPANNPDDLTETKIDLAPALKGGAGHVIVVAEATKGRAATNFHAWVQVTRMAVSTFRDADELVSFVSELSTGAPLGGVDVQIGGASVKTGADGLARQPLANGSAVLARRGNDVAFLSLVPPWQGSATTRQEIKDQVRWFVFDDRKTYKPGEEVRVKGWIRRVGMKKGGDLGFVDGTTRVRWAAADVRGHEFTKGEAEIDKTGAFDLAFKIPDSVNLGHARVNLHLLGATSAGESDAVHAFAIQEFRRPEFEVTTATTEGPHLVGGHAVATMTAAYYAGGGLSSTEVNWSVTRDEAVFTPPNRSDYVFGHPRDFFDMGGFGKGFGPRHRESPAETWKSITDGQGKHSLRVDFEALEPAYPMTLHLEASLQDKNRQTFASSTNILVHPGSIYVGIRRARSFVRAGEVIDVATIATDIDGRAVRGRKVTVSSARLDWEQKGTEFVDVDRDVRTCEVTSADDAVHCNLPTTTGGRYRITAWVTDDQGRKNQSETAIWVAGDEMPSDSRLPEDALTVVADKDEYQVGDTAELLLMSPFPGEAVVSVGRQGIVHLQRVKMAKSSTTVRIPIEPSWLPNAQVSIQVTGLAPRKNASGEVDARLPKRPAYATGSVQLKIAPRDRKLAVTVKPREAKIEPGGRTVVELDVRDASDRPAANTQLALIVVDEAVLALSKYETPDPMRTFYANRADGVQTATLLEYVRVQKTPASPESGVISDSLAAGGMGGAELKRAEAAPPPPPPAPMMADPRMAAKQSNAAGAASTPIHLRSDLTPLAAFVPRVLTDAKGHASVEVKLPDNLTRYRIMAIAVEGATRFGSGESSVTARLPLMVRPSAPRFLNFGDRFEFPIVVQNQTDQAMTVDVAARGANADVAATGKRVTVPANDRVEVRLAANARRAGTARFQVGAVSGRWADASQVELPVWTPATTEAFATYGQIDEGAIVQPVKVPSGIVTEYGGVSVSTSSTALQALTDAVTYLVDYPFECNEQIASRIVAIASLKDVLAAFDAKSLPPPEKLIERVQADVELLRRFQQADGGWSFWGNQRESWPYLSVHVAHALARAKDKGFKVDPGMLDRSKKYLRDIGPRLPKWYSADAARAIKAYALFVRHVLGDTDRAGARRLVAEAGGAAKLPLEADGWLLRVLTGDAGSQTELGAIRTHLANRVTETAGAAHFVTNYEDGAHVLLASERRADGVILESLIVDQPKSDLIAKIVAGLLGHRTAGRWASTQENAFVLVALDRYFRTYEGTKPDFVARAWLGDKLATEHAFRGRSTDRANTDIPMRLLPSNEGKITLAKDGPGRLYFRIGMTYAPADLKPPPADHGFTVSRSYEAVDRPDDVRRDPDGTVRVKAGARVRVRLTMVAPTRRYHVALVDPLPAGLEPLNAALAVTETVPSDPKAPDNSPMWIWGRNWVEHQNMRDNRVEAFATLVWEGAHPYTYVARATTPGTYVVPPPKAEEMYSPETFGRGPGDRLVVE